MTETTRKAAVAAYKERKIAAGIYAIRCAAAMRCGSAARLTFPIENRLWFTLRQGANPHRALQEAWNAHGSAAFTFDVIAHLRDEEDPGYPRRTALGSASALAEQLGGARI
jgi:hypothetical protein